MKKIDFELNKIVPQKALTIPISYSLNKYRNFIYDQGQLRFTSGILCFFKN